MKNVKLIIQYLFFGISWGCTYFVFHCLFCYAFGADDTLSLILNDFAKHAAGAILVGIGFGTTPIVYQINRLSLAAKILIHFTVGMGVFYPVALYLGWIPFYSGRPIYTALQFLFSCAIFAAIWFYFYLFNRNEAKKINGRLRELEKTQDNDNK